MADILYPLANKTRVDAHVAGTAEKHAAEKVTYSGSVVGATDVKQGIDLLKARVDEIITTPISGEAAAQELVDARDGEATLGDRFGGIDSQLADVATQINSLDAQARRVKSNFRNTKFIAHRGVSQFAPENTMPAFEMAYDMGFYGIETDVLKTADGKWIVFHDTTVDRMTDGTGIVSEMTLAQIQALNIDAGNGVAKYDTLKIPTLEAFLEVCSRFNIVPMIEAKFIFTDIVSVEFVSILKKYGLEDKSIVTAYQMETLESIRKYSDKIQLIWVLETWSDANITTMLDKKIDGCALTYSITDQTKADLCHANGLLVASFLFNTQNNIRDKQSLRLDYIYSDFINGEV